MMKIHLLKGTPICKRLSDLNPVKGGWYLSDGGALLALVLESNRVILFHTSSGSIVQGVNTVSECMSYYRPVDVEIMVNS